MSRPSRRSNERQPGPSRSILKSERIRATRELLKGLDNEPDVVLTTYKGRKHLGKLYITRGTADRIAGVVLVTIDGQEPFALDSIKTIKEIQHPVPTARESI